MIYKETSFSIVLILLVSLLFISCSDKKPKVIHGYTSSELAKMNKKGKVPTTFPQIHTNLGGMVREFIRVFYQDSKNNFWFGTNGDGVIRYNGLKLDKFTLVDGLGGSAVRGIVEDRNGIIWFGTSEGLIKYDGEIFTTYTKKDGLLDNEVWELMIDNRGFIWVGSVEGLSVFDGEDFRVFEVPKPEVENPKPHLSAKRVSKIMEDRNGNMWFANDGYGISIYNGEEWSFLTKKNGLTDNNVADLYEDINGNIWIGTFYGGVSSFDGKTFSNYTKDGLVDEIETYGFCEDRKGNIWFSVENVGVYKYDGESFTKFTTEDGLTTNGILSIYEDNKEQIWFGSWSGISIYDGDTIINAVAKEPWTK